MKILLICQNLRNTNPNAISFSFNRAFKELGHQSTLYDLSYYTNRYFNFIVKKNTLLRKKILMRINSILLEHLKTNSYDAIFVVKGTYLLPETIEEIASKNWISCFNPDDPFYSESWGGSLHSNIPDSIKFYKHYFIWSKRLVSKIYNEFKVDSTYLPFAIDGDLIKKDKKELLYDISFIGNSDKVRQTWLNNISGALNEKGKKVNVFGKYWKPNTGIQLHDGMFGEDYFNVFKQSRININILRDQNKGAINMRTFEIPSSGSFMMHEYSEEAVEFYKPDKEAVYFETVDELIDKSEFYLKNESNRQKIAEAGFNRSLKSGYSYFDRAKSIIDAIY